MFIIPAMNCHPVASQAGWDINVCAISRMDVKLTGYGPSLRAGYILCTLKIPLCVHEEQTCYHRHPGKSQNPCLHQSSGLHVVFRPQVYTAPTVWLLTGQQLLYCEQIDEVVCFAWRAFFRIRSAIDDYSFFPTRCRAKQNDLTVYSINIMLIISPFIIILCFPSTLTCFCLNIMPKQIFFVDS